jgi:hypothetical protein
MHEDKEVLFIQIIRTVYDNIIDACESTKTIVARIERQSNG